MGNLIQVSGSYSLIIFILCILLHLAISSEPESNLIFSKAEVQSCSGCSLNRLPEVKAFIFEDVPNYFSLINNSDGVTFKHIQGAVPELVLYSYDFKEVERIPMKDLSRKECNSLLKDKGFKWKNEKLEKEL